MEVDLEKLMKIKMNFCNRSPGQLRSVSKFGNQLTSISQFATNNFTAHKHLLHWLDNSFFHHPEDPNSLHYFLLMNQGKFEKKTVT